MHSLKLLHKRLVNSQVIQHKKPRRRINKSD